jgi:outer membrane protein OmpA-like peptidoglycan-associated protein
MEKSFFIRKHTLALVLSMLFTTVAFAQRPKHYLGGWLFAGYSAMFHNIDNTSVLGGAGAGIGGGYQFKKGLFILNTGLEFELINSSTKISNLEGQCLISDTEGDEAVFNYDALKYNSKHRLGLLNVPILAGMQFEGEYNFYFLLGAKVGMPVLGTYGGRGSIKTSGIYERFIERFENITTHYYHMEHKFKGIGGKTDFSPINVMASAEFGIELNKYIFKAAKQSAEKSVKKSKNTKEEPRIRVAVFADYGLLNINNNQPSGTDVLVLKSSEDWFTPGGVIKNKLPVSDFFANDIAFSNGKVKPVNPFIVGVKGTIFFDITPPKKEKKKPEPKPEPPQKPRILFITGKIVNVETGAEVTTATVDMFDQKGAKVYSAKPQYGIFNTKLDRKGTYKVNVNAPNYNAYSETFSNVGDTLMVYIEPIKENTSFIIKNIFFEFDKTVLINTSNQALDELANFLKENPGISIKIVGHTDSKGTDAYNQRLSEGRAKSVVEALTARGIEAERLASEGKAAREPIATNETEEGRAENRRVEFIITDVK